MVSATFCGIFSLRQGALFFLSLSGLLSVFDMFAGISAVGGNCPAAELLFLTKGFDKADGKSISWNEEESAIIRGAVQARNADQITKQLCNIVAEDDQYTKLNEWDPGEKATPVCQVKGTLKFCQGVIVFYAMAFAWVCTSAPLPSRKNIWFVIGYVVLMGIVEIWNVYGHMKSHLDEAWAPEMELSEMCCYQWDKKAGHCTDHLWGEDKGFISLGFWFDAAQAFLHGWNIVVLFSLIHVIEAGGTGDEMVANDLLLDICHIDTPDRLVASSFCWYYTVKQGIVVVSGLIFISAVGNAVVCTLRLTGILCEYGSEEGQFYQDAVYDDLEWKWPYCTFVIAETWLSFTINALQWTWRSQLMGVDTSWKTKAFKFLVLLETLLTMFMACAAFMIAACYFPAFGAGRMGVDGCIYFVRILFLIWLHWLEWSLHYILEAGGTGNEHWEDVVDLIRAALGVHMSPGSVSGSSKGSSEKDNLEALLGDDEEVVASGSEDAFLDDLLGGGLGSDAGSGSGSAGGGSGGGKQSAAPRGSVDSDGGAPGGIDDLLGASSVSSGDKSKPVSLSGSDSGDKSKPVSLSGSDEEKEKSTKEEKK